VISRGLQQSFGEKYPAVQFTPDRRVKRVYLRYDDDYALPPEALQAMKQRVDELDQLPVEPWDKPGKWFYIGVARMMSFGRVKGLLNRHGIESFTMGSSLLAESIYVVGRDTAFKARQVLRENAEKEKLDIGWTGDYLVHDPDEETLRVADVTIASGSTVPVMDLLEGRRIDVDVYFGSVKDCLVVPRNQVLDALAILREQPIQGMTVLPPEGFQR
jgi:hypothetical protein